MKQSIGSGRGSVYNIIMKALQSGDKYGYEICQEIENKTNGNYILKQPSLYSGLKRLEAQKLVESYWGDSEIGGRRHYYRLTPAGKEKIESSNFSWEDERNELVDTFFEKSELETKLDDIKEDISSLQSNIENVDMVNQQTKEIIENSGEIENQPIKSNQNNQFMHQVNSNQFDLFSFSSFSNKNESENTVNEEQKEEQKIEVVEDKKEDEINNEDKQLFEDIKEETEVKQEIETNDEPINEKYSISLLDLVNSNEDAKQNDEIINNVETEVEQDGAVEHKTEEMVENQSQTLISELNIDEYYKNKKTSSFSESSNDYENSNEQIKIEPIKEMNLDESSCVLKNDERIEVLDLFTPINSVKRDQQVEETKEEPKQQDIKDIFSSSAFISHRPIEEVENELHTDEIKMENASTDEEITNESLEKTEEQIRLEQEKFMSDVLSGNTQNINNNENEKKIDEFTNINFESIFGDTLVQDNNINQDNNVKNENTDNDSPVINESKEDTMPRYELNDNVNFTLSSDKVEHTEKIRETDNFTQKINENYYNSLNENKVESSTNFNNSHTNFEKQPNNTAVSFDKKFENSFEDFIVRPLRKNNIEKKVSGFVNINKLNLFSSLIIGIISLFVLIVSSVSNGQSLSGLQLVMFICAIIFPISFVIVNFIRFVQNKDKKIEYNFEKELFSTLLVVNILSILILFCLNMLYGMNFSNMGQLYFGSFISITVDLIILVFYPIVKYILNKISYFNK